MQRVDRSAAGEEMLRLLYAIGNRPVHGDKRADDASRANAAQQALRLLKETK
jgi:hypothetical protein